MSFAHQSSLVNQQSDLMTGWQDPILETSEDNEKTRPGSLAQSRKASIPEVDFTEIRDGTSTPLLKTIDRVCIRDRLAFAARESKKTLAGFIKVLYCV